MIVAAGRGEGERYETCVNVVQDALPIALARPYSKFVLPPGTKVKYITCTYTYSKLYMYICMYALELHNNITNYVIFTCIRLLHNYVYFTFEKNSEATYMYE